ncbi:MAG: PfkB family carbohydrate kinase [Acidobacteriota bacterium]
MKNFPDTILNEFPKRNVVILGDLVADQFLGGTIARVSREAPVFILSHDNTETLAGGAANAAVNVASLGGKAIAVGLVGKDSNGDALLEKLKTSKVNCDFVVATEKFQTTTKIRVLAGHHYAMRQQVIRIDYENKTQVDKETREQLKQNLIAACQDADALIISDYSLDSQFGVVDEEIKNLSLQISKEKNIPLVLDSRFSLNKFYGVTSATPNQDEVEQILGQNFTEADCFRLVEKLDFQSLLVTRGNKGMLLIEKGKEPLELDSIGSKEPVDVTGAGDTVIATYALSLASGMTFAESATIANHAGGIVVMKKRTAVVSVEELLESLKYHSKPEQKAQTL